jgi:hypothetical protein
MSPLSWLKSKPIKKQAELIPLNFYGLHDIIFQKTELFIKKPAGTSDPTYNFTY